MHLAVFLSMVFWLILIIAYACILVLFIRNQLNWRLSPRTYKILRTVHYSVLAVCLLTAISYCFFGWGWRGLWTIRILIHIVVLTGFVYAFLRHPYRIGVLQKYYLRFVRIFIAIGLITLPTYPVLSAYGWLYTPPQIRFNGPVYNVQYSFRGIFRNHKMEIFKKYGPLEKSIPNSGLCGRETHHYNLTTYYTYFTHQNSQGKVDTVILETLEHYAPLELYP